MGWICSCKGYKFIAIVEVELCCALVCCAVLCCVVLVFAIQQSNKFIECKQRIGNPQEDGFPRLLTRQRVIHESTSFAHIVRSRNWDTCIMRVISKCKWISPFVWVNLWICGRNQWELFELRKAKKECSVAKFQVHTASVQKHFEELDISEMVFTNQKYFEQRRNRRRHAGKNFNRKQYFVLHIKVGVLMNNQT